MKNVIVLVFLVSIFYKANAQNSISVADTIVTGSVEKNYPGGFKAFNIYVEKNARPPVIAYENRKVGTTYVSFIIEPDGSISNIYTILAAGSGMDEEVIRVINDSKSWLPTKLDNKLVRTFCRAGVQFFADFDKKSMWVEAKQID
ncbi:energy transducer TonB [Mucilaginibacter sp. BJC16-A38]|uniref:energy transducer TonB n=1 Tax=Mucilaginibacter phenanthrenivorans TaxID=1234842 RepID=UPI0021571DA1|nr:energy transducer TonB [Mucilaginibacter phenanthrenivorans]MCR8556732.1 energy transducer TonB [Mucilaginibacter phenanthrenivorans]